MPKGLYAPTPRRYPFGLLKQPFKLETFVYFFEEQTMILTDNFVYIHQPKTGGTFVTKMICRLYKNRGYKTRLRRLLGAMVGDTGGGMLDTSKYGDKHSGCLKIPAPFKRKAICSTIRNPYDYYVSEYKFSWWKQYPEKVFYDANLVKQKYSDLNQVTFADYLDLINQSHRYQAINTPHLEAESSIGWLSRRFLHLFARKPLETLLKTIDETYIASKQYSQDLFTVSFLRTESLNQDLYEFLTRVGYKEAELSFILESTKVKPPLPLGGLTRDGDGWQSYYKPELKKTVREKERLLFSIFPEYDL
ncbi:MAG: sulfotransferase family protein [Pseudanabaenales cyanobacterium]|nr:sulfotransferase family protein [Pseudanabaenales cyanobacterium]